MNSSKVIYHLKQTGVVVRLALGQASVYEQARLNERIATIAVIGGLMVAHMLSLIVTPAGGRRFDRGILGHCPRSR